MAELTPQKALIFRIMHIDNVPWILENGLHCRSSNQSHPGFREIGNPELIGKRAHRIVPIPPGGTLGDYIPFYFTPHSPMLLNIKTGHMGMRQTPMRDIAILVSSLPKLIEQNVEFVFTDRHAYLTAALFSNKLNDLDRIDWPILQARDFKRDPDNPAKFERYQAEALIHRYLPVSSLRGIVCHGKAQESTIRDEMDKIGVSLKLVIQPDWYF